MFLSTVLARNPALVDAAAELHRAGAIPPDTYVVDLDAVEANAALLAAEAGRLGLGLWFVVKQIGRNPELIRAIVRHLPRYAAIDRPEAEALHAAGGRAGNLGHLAQIPRRALPALLARRPEAVTVFDVDNARAVSDTASELGFVQDVLVRVEGAADATFPGQEGGVPLAGLEAFAGAVERMDGVQIAGVTAFPCLRCDPATGLPEPTPNLRLALQARTLLSDRGHGHRDEHGHGRGHAPLKLSAPGVTCAATLPLLAAHGVTHGEPGHALTGTTPLHAADLRQPERPAYVYVTEVAHTLVDGRPALFGGGFYPRGGVESALLPRTGERLAVLAAPPGHIDYYRLLAPPVGPRPRPGDTALLAFRTQMFVTRSTVAVVAGLSRAAPRLVGLYDSHGRPDPYVRQSPGRP
ncbi:alanine racemase [Streptomyces cavernicola]|uniref:Alanine racemase n=1 Tax=Streptomyces cavernicola TaxID=3043613 RepID=A0ABT6SD29_9ACTN|nr:alanine racemase [Streptomyces sp. B-S-A6]MDI3406093.1 alanine racemase [Streptomyces sp. B-S-A6]